MRDRLSKERRSWNMSRIRGKDTTPEKVVRSLLHRLGYRFPLHVRIPVQLRNAECGVEKVFRVRGSKFKVQGSRSQDSQLSTHPSQPTQRRFVTPDLVLPKHRVAIFVHGCFWHRHRGCKNCTTPTHRRAWWLAKLEGNAARDKVHQRALRKLGWRTIVVWECETEKPKQLEQLTRRLTKRFEVR